MSTWKNKVLEQPIRLNQLLPHSGPMLMLSGIVFNNEQSIQCSCTIQEDNPLLVEGVFPLLAGVELFAQTAGVYFGLQAAKNIDNRTGAVVQVKSFEVFRSQVPVGAQLMIDAQYLAGNENAIMMEGGIAFEGCNVFKGNLMIALSTQNEHDT